MQLQRSVLFRPKSLLKTIGCIALLLFGQQALAGDIRIVVGNGYGSSHGYQHDYRTRSGFALGYGVGGRFDRGQHDRHKHQKRQKHHNFKPYRYKSNRHHPDKHNRQHGYRNYGRSFSDYHDNASRYRHDPQKGHRRGYGDGRHHQRRRQHNQLGR